MDKITGKRMAPVTTGQIYWGAIPFVVIQVLMVALLITFPQMSLVYKSGLPEIDINKLKIEIPQDEPADKNAPADDLMKQLGAPSAPAPPPGKAEPEKGPPGKGTPQKGAAEKSPEDKAAEEIEKQLRGGK